jgi:hypothetical protein
MDTKRLSVKMLIKTVLLLVVFLTTTGCGPGQLLGLTLTPIPTNTLTPTATSSPTPTRTPTTAPTATPRPTQIPEQTVFSDSFDDNGNHWELETFTKIEDGLMQIDSGRFQLAAIKILLESTPDNVAVRVDILPNPPAGADPSVFLYGAGCRVNRTASDFIFLGLSPAPRVDGFFVGAFLKFKESKLVDYQFFPVELPDSQNGDGVAATFRCSEDHFAILNGRQVVSEVTDGDFQEGSVFLGLYQPEGIAGSVRFDNLTVIEIQ